MRNHAYNSLTDQQLKEIDELCDRFDQELVRGLGPQVETFLSAAPETARDGMLAELLAMEIEFRSKVGDEFDPNEYVQRFPQQARVIAQLFGRTDATQFSGGDTSSPAVDIPSRIGNFRLIEEIGRGGMGVVWLAEQDEPVRRRVALKLIKPEFASKEVIARFAAEKQALSLMDHQNIARVLDAGTTSDDRPYFVMELVNGIPITQYCDDNKLSVDERLKLFVLVCRAVQHAHQKGIIHRDLKPSNVLVTVIDDEAVPKVIDFGLAKAVKQNTYLTDETLLTDFGKVVGTVQYMSPEQAEVRGVDAEDVDTRTDVYSLGVMLYELLTGSTPVDKETLGKNALLKVLEIIRDEAPPRPSNRLSSSSNEVNSAVGDQRRTSPARLSRLLQGELDWVVMRALEKDPTRRYQTANDFAQDLSNYLMGNAVFARPPSTWYQIQKFARRNRGLVAAMLAIGAALMAGITGTSYGLFQAYRKTAEVTASEQLALTEKANARKNEERAIGAEELAAAEAKRAQDSEARATFQLAVARYDADRAVDARRLLQQIPIEYRDNFEWHYCNRRFQGSDITCYGHTGDVYEVAFTPDSTRVVSVAGDGKIKLWDPITGREIGTFGDHAGRVLALAISADGTRIASAGDDKTVVLWDAESREAIQTSVGHTGAIDCIAFSPSGDRIASASEDKTIKVWDAKTGEEIFTITGHTAAVRGVAYSPDGKHLASVGEDKLIRIWDAQSGTPITELSKHGIGVQSVAFSPDGTRLIASSFNYVSLWDAQTWQFIAESGIHAGQVRCVSFSPDGTQFATGSDDAKIKLWDSRAGMIIKTFSGHAKSVLGVAFSPDGSRLVSGSSDRTLKIWDTSGKDRTTRIGETFGDNAITLLGHSGQVYSVVFSPDGRLLASGGKFGTILLRNAQTCEVLFTLKGHTASVNELSFSPDGTRLASGGDDHMVRLWDTLTGQEVAVLKGHTSWVRGVAFRPDGTGLASAGRDGTVKLWDANTYQETATLKGHRGDVYCVAFSPDGTCLASGSFDQTIKLWDAQTGQEIRTLHGHTGRVRAIAFGPRGERIVSGGYDTKVRVWNVDSGKQTATGHVRSGVAFGIAFSPDGKRIAVGHGGTRASLIDAFSGRELIQFYLGNSGASGLNFSSSGKRLAVTATGIARVRIFDAQEKHETRFLSGHTDLVTRVSFSADGSRIYSESENEKLVWDIAKKSRMETPDRRDVPVGSPRLSNAEAEKNAHFTDGLFARLNQDASWKFPKEVTRTSPDGRWFVTTELNNVVLVDLEHKNTPDEQGYRIAKASFDPFWHQEQAISATKVENWFAAVFHYAWLLKHDPGSVVYYDGLHASYQELESQFEERGGEGKPYSGELLRDTLSLPRGK